jgi:hypothetical protein
MQTYNVSTGPRWSDEQAARAAYAALRHTLLGFRGAEVPAIEQDAKGFFASEIITYDPPLAREHVVGDLAAGLARKGL